MMYRQEEGEEKWIAALGDASNIEGILFEIEAI